MSGAAHSAAKSLCNSTDPVLALAKYAFEFVLKMVESVSKIPADSLLRMQSDAESCIPKTNDKSTSGNSACISVGLKRRRI
ncbi:MAG: hypothetical protein ACK521_07005 [bacterium]